MTIPLPRLRADAVTSSESGDVVSLQWPQSPGSVPAARHQLRDVLQGWSLADLESDSAIVLSELLSNAVQHAHGPDSTVKTRFCRLADGRGVRIEVHDADTSRLPRMPSEVGDEDIRGRGLQLVAACTAQRWGIVLSAEDKAVWGEVMK